MQTRRSGFLFVTKISKFCNLRCTYCYEFDELANTQRMSLDQLRAFFIHVADAAQRYGRNSLHFVWHGGEPLLIPLDYYEQIGQMQREIFPSGIEVANFVQTNLTVLTDRHLTWLKEKRFFAQGLGVSFDVYGDQRVDRRGRLRTEAVLANLQRLKDAEIRFGAITVLARNTLPRIREIFTFYESLGISFRLLPFYKSAYDAQVRDHALGLSEIADAFKAVFDAWWVSERPMSIQPLDEYLLYALAVLRDTPKWFHDPDAEEYVFLVDTDGSTYGQADTYVSGRAYGNVFDQNFATLLDSSVRKQGVREARARLNDHCASCPYYGHCPGIFAAEASAEQRRMLRTEGCQVREVIGHMVQRLADTEVGQRIARAGRDQGY